MSDGVALATHMKLTVGLLLTMTYYLAELAEIRACDDRDHNERRPYADYAMILWHFPNRLVLYSFTFVLRGLAFPPGSVDVIPTAGCAQCAWCSLWRFVRACALGALFLRSCVRDSDVRVRA